MPYIKASISIPITRNGDMHWLNEKESTNAVYFNQYEMPHRYKQHVQPGVSIGTTLSLIHAFKNVIEITYQTTGGHVDDNFRTISVTGSRLTFLVGVRFSK
jgi:hypothetical protein